VIEQSFISYLKYEKRYSPHTILAYETDLTQAFEYFRSMYEVEHYNDVTHQYVRSWIVSLVTEKQVARSINRKMSSLRAYYKFLQRDGGAKVNPTTRLKALKQPKRLPQYIQEHQSKQMLDILNVGTDFASRRNNLLITTLYYTGMRRSELIELKESDIDRAQGYIRVLGKGSKVRLLPIGSDFMKLLEEYISQKRELFPEEDYLFVTEKGVKLYPKFVYNVVCKHLSMVSTVSQKGPHTLRHTFATHLTNKGADLNAIKDLLGHASLSATQIYTHNSIDKLKAAYGKAHPKAKL